MIFIYLQKNHFLISEKTQRELREKHQDLELIRTFRTIQDARSWVMKQSREVLDLVAKQHTGITPEGRERMRDKKRGRNNSNAGGLSLIIRRTFTIGHNHYLGRLAIYLAQRRLESSSSKFIRQSRIE